MVIAWRAQSRRTIQVCTKPQSVTRSNVQSEDQDYCLALQSLKSLDRRMFIVVQSQGAQSRIRRCLFADFSRRGRKQRRDEIFCTSSSSQRSTPQISHSRPTIMTALLQPPPLPTSALDRPTHKHLITLYLSLRRGQLRGSTAVALATALAFRRVISGARFNSIDELTDAIRLTGAWLQEARRGEQAVTNITLRTLHLLAEEASAVLAESNAPSRAGSSYPATPSVTSTAAPSTAMFGGMSSGSSQSQTVASPLSSPGPAGDAPSRPPMFSRDSRYFGQGSTFSISDLVAAGQNANSSSQPSTGYNSVFNSGANTPALTRDGSGYGFSATLGRSDSSQGKDVSFSSFGAAGGTVMEEDEGVNDEATAHGGDSESEEIDDASEESEDDEDIEAADDGAVGSKAQGAGTSSSQLRNAFHLKPLLIQAVQELIDELESTRSNIARDARDHIHGGEVVLTLGHSSTVESFLKQASRDRTFTVLAADAGSSKGAAKLASALPKSIRVVSVPHSAIHTLLPRVTKLILSPHAVLANGGLLAAPGSTAAALAARLQSTPTLVLAGLHKVCGDWRWVGIASSGAGTGAASAGRLTSSHPTSSKAAAAASLSSAPLAGDSYTKAPQSVLPPTGTGTHQGPVLLEEIQEVLSNEWDYVEPSDVDVLITNTGEYPPSYLYRLVVENFAE